MLGLLSAVWYSDRIKFRPYNFLTDPTSKDNCGQRQYFFDGFFLSGGVSPQRPYLQELAAYSCQSLPSCSLLQVVWVQPAASSDSRFVTLVHMSLIEANIHWRECMHRQTNSTLEVPEHYSVENVSIACACWWHRIAVNICRRSISTAASIEQG